MKNKLEQLLNSLIEKGWKPSGKECSHFIMQNDAKVLDWKVIYTAVRKDEGVYNIHYTLRELVSKESGLWQFCMANHLLKKYSDLGDDGEYIIGRWQDGKDCKTEDGEYIDDNRDSDIYHQDDSYQYRLIESSLKDESELEDFLLNSIKLD